MKKRKINKRLLLDHHRTFTRQPTDAEIKQGRKKIRNKRKRLIVDYRQTSTRLPTNIMRLSRFVFRCNLAAVSLLSLRAYAAMLSWTMMKLPSHSLGWRMVLHMQLGMCLSCYSAIYFPESRYLWAWESVVVWLAFSDILIQARRYFVMEDICWVMLLFGAGHTVWKMFWMISATAILILFSLGASALGQKRSTGPGLGIRLSGPSSSPGIVSTITGPQANNGPGASSGPLAKKSSSSTKGRAANETLTRRRMATAKLADLAMACEELKLLFLLLRFLCLLVLLWMEKGRGLLYIV
ncbi:hypothetical protein MA16_Dca008833 [Dendrobium catenatum]|uniref:Uncharacterized protein n=1 Tax=Dendrobium catenatum TaxID=906689 RepID=A0A2I0VUH5_9ASPA|nr:hypothetical protein MA16_Dca008833 [Dendrobium catenatum]